MKDGRNVEKARSKLQTARGSRKGVQKGGLRPGRKINKNGWPDLDAELMNLSNDPTRKTDETSRKSDPATKPRGRDEKGSKKQDFEGQGKEQ